ncbi:MAG: S1C family serine protease [Gemmataceae bacterium]
MPPSTISALRPANNTNSKPVACLRRFPPMRKLSSYLLVAAVAAGVTWFAASRRHDVLLPGAPPDPPPVDLTELTPDERIAVSVYQNDNRSVVHINTRSAAADDWGFSEPREGSGSGSVLDKAGHILTNYHVVDGARRIDVLLFDGSSHEAKLVGTDPNNDLAVIQIDAAPDLLYPIAWGDSNRLIVGMRVFALGNPFGLDRTLTTGIVSSLNRSMRSENNRLIRGVIQTDAAINPGNSGGPLLNSKGALVGINTAMIGRAGQSAGIGLAIPSNTARRVVEELIRHGRVIRPDSGIQSVYQTDNGLLVSRLDPDGPAAKAGLRGPQVKTVRRGDNMYRALDRSKADLIVGADGLEVKTLDDLLGIIEAKKPGDTVVLRVLRDGKPTDVTITLADSGQ